MDGQVLHKYPIPEQDTHLICRELHVILACFTSLEINDIEAGRLAHIGQSYHDNIEDFSRVISEGLLNERCVDIDSTAEHIGGLLVNLLGLKLDWSILTINHSVDTSFT